LPVDESRLIEDIESTPMACEMAGMSEDCVDQNTYLDI
jgi:hypothetical protein